MGERCCSSVWSSLSKSELVAILVNEILLQQQVGFIGYIRKTATLLVRRNNGVRKRVFFFRFIISMNKLSTPCLFLVSESLHSYKE